MAHAVFTVLLAIHAAIHVLGFVKWWGLAPVPLSGRTFVSLSPAGARAFAALWLAPTVLLLVAVTFRVLRDRPWWDPALAGVLLSQGLVIIAWHDAKAGTAVNLVIAVVAVVGAAQARFERTTDTEIRAMLAHASAPAPVSVERAQLQQVPPPVRAWLERAGVVGRQIRTVRLKQRGEIRTSPRGRWMATEAEQYFTVEPPAFVWRVSTSIMGLPISGRDEYTGGRGRMLIQAASFVNLVNEAGDKIDQGAMLRFLGETVWFPSAVLSPYVAWEAIGATSAKATMRYGGVSASAVFKFSPDGRVLGMEAARFMGGGADAKLERWVVSCTEWRAFTGVEVPTRGEVTWKLQDEDFTYYRWEILDIEFNLAEPYGAAVRVPVSHTLADARSP